MNRTVQYWRITRPDGSALPGRFPAQRVVKQLVKAEADDKNRYRVCRDGMVLLGKGVAEPDHRMLILDKVRRENLPSVGNSAGARRAIGLSPDEGLLEPTYCLFTRRNILAMLTSGDGPRPRRLVDYLRAKLNIDIAIAPILTQNLDQVLAEMRVSAIDVAIPANRITRDLVGGDWVQALDGARTLAQDGVVRVGISVGRSGDAAHKQTMRRRIRQMTDLLRGSDGLSEFNSARVTGTMQGTNRSLNLLEDHFVEKTEVDADRINDPDRSAEYARELLRSSRVRNKEYLESAVPAVADEIAEFPTEFIETPDDERQ